ncbi:Protein sprint [Gryllus bimaculatus]|nr:Protein sprint [Gryllus bimaculatus]
MAISVRLPAGKGPYIEHYLIQASGGQLSLESSDNRFDNIPSLVAHYSQCCDELPVQLTLPRALREAKNRQQLSSLALLGQEFWRYPMANPRPLERAQPTEMGSAQRVPGVDGQPSPASSASSLSSFSSGNNLSCSMVSQTPTSELGGDPIVLNLAPLTPATPSIESPQQPASLLSTFKGPSTDIGSPSSPTTTSTASPTALAVVASASGSVTSLVAAVTRGPRPTPPNTLNLANTQLSGSRSASSSPAQAASEISSAPSSAPRPGGGKTPPPPPPRWAKPTSLAVMPNSQQQQQNFTVTTTVTFSVNDSTGPPPPHVEVSCVQMAPRRPVLELEGLSTASPVGAGPSLHQIASPTSPSPSTPNGDARPQVGAGRTRKSHRPSHLKQQSSKESRHYRESDILDSPTVYYRSSVADKVSDYEDIWGPEGLSTFKPVVPRSSPFSSPEDISTSSGNSKRTPDLLERVASPGSPACLLERVGTPVSPACSTPLSSQREIPRGRLQLILPAPGSTGGSSNANSPAEEMQPKQGSPFYAEPADALKQAAIVPRRRPRPQQLLLSGPRHRHSDPTLLQQWPSAGPSASAGRPGVLERIDSSDELPPMSSSVDNLAVLRGPSAVSTDRARNGAVPAAQVPPPSGAGRARGKPVQPPRIKPMGMGKSFNDTSWAVDSSWEFIGNEEEGVIDEGLLEDGGGERRLPTLCLSPEILSPTTNAGTTTSTLEGPLSTGGLASRMSSYDNIEGGRPGTEASSISATSSMLHNGDRACSHISDNDDTATIFSEPWDSSRWESLLASGGDGGDRTGEATQGASGQRETDEGQNVTGGAGASELTNHPVVRNKSFKERLDPLLCDVTFIDDFYKSIDVLKTPTLMCHPCLPLVPVALPGSKTFATTVQRALLAMSVGHMFPLVHGKANCCILTARQLESLPPLPKKRSKPGRAMGQFAQKFTSYIRRTAQKLAGFTSNLFSPPPRLQALRNRDAGGSGSAIRAYALHLAADASTTFAQNIDNFIACTRESRETNPQVVMRNMRQFMSGMKNYLVKHGEREFEKEVEKERIKLKANEFLNLDAILEAVMHKLVVRPLKEHLYRLFVEEYSRSGAIQLLADNISYARTRAPHELGLRARLALPAPAALAAVCAPLRRLQEVDSPLEKLECLLACIAAIFSAVKQANRGRHLTLGADDFLPLFVWVLVRSGMVAAEVEAEYMWGLLHPSLLSGEGGYYLTTLSSAVHVLKNFRACHEQQERALALGHAAGALDWRVGSLSELQSVLKIVVPDELHGSIITKTLPVRPNMTTRDVCKIIAHKVRITNPQDYGLFKLVDGEETLLGDGECPQDVRGGVSQLGKHCIFAYKRIDAKIAWPRTASPQ